MGTAQKIANPTIPSFSLLVVVVVLGLLLSCAPDLTKTADIAGIREGACITPPVLGPADLAWIFTTEKVGNFYAPLASKYQVYKTAKLMLKKPMEEITDKELASACLVCTATRMNGFGGRYLVPENNFVRMGVLETKYKGTDVSGTVYMTLTDRKSYIVNIGFWNDENEKSWVVASTKPTLDPTDKEKILQHIASFGFDPKLAYEIDYSKCPGPDVDNAKTEL